MPNFSSASKTPNSSSNRNSVLLHTWWLIKVEEESKLGVGGYVNRETAVSRRRRLLGSASSGKRCNPNKESQTEIKVFYSAAITKRVNNNTLETVDGFTIMLIGGIHRSRTLSYGFSLEVCDHFLSGFPFDWACEMFMSSTGESETCEFTSIIVNDILKQCTHDSFARTEGELDHKQDEISLKATEEAHVISSSPADLHEDLGDSKEAEAARILSRAGTLCESHLDPKRKQCDTNTLLEVQDRYPLRHKQMKKNN